MGGAGRQRTPEGEGEQRTRVTQPRPKPAKYDRLKVGWAVLDEVIAQDPARLTVDQLVERIVSDPNDDREVMTARTAVRELRIAGLARITADESVEATGTARHAEALFNAV